MLIKPKLFLITFLFAVIFNFACSSKTEPEKTTISGQIKNAPNGILILTQEEDINRKKRKIIDKIPLDSDGNFSKAFNLEPHIYNLNIDDDKRVTLAINKGQQITINGDANDLKNIKTSGSEDTKKLQEYENFRNESLDRLVVSVRDKIKKVQSENNPENAEEIEKLGKEEIDNYDKHKDELIDFVKKNMGDSVAVYATSLRWDGEKNIPFLDNLAKDFENKYPDLDITKKIREKVEVLKNTSIGGKVSDINLPDKDGKDIPLLPLKGKYTLIDFWASWCSPCRRESETLENVYAKYKDKGFEIYGVSLDENKQKWLDAVEQDKRTWTNVSSLQGFETPITFDYAVTALPAKFIIDKDGKIIAKNLHGKELEKKIESLFSE